MHILVVTGASGVGKITAVQALDRRGIAGDTVRFKETAVRQALPFVLACASAFFAFYTIRLLVVTSFLTRTRSGGGGAFVGAVTFPLLSLAFGCVVTGGHSRVAFRRA